MAQASSSAPTRMLFLLHGEDPFRLRLRANELVHALLAGVPTYRTDQDGTVEIALDGTSLVVRTHANALPPPRRGSLPHAPARQ